MSSPSANETEELSELDTHLQEFVGTAFGPAWVARDPVNQAMIRHWCDAMGDANPVYTDSEAAAESIHGGIVAPPTMLQAWTMPGLGPKAIDDDGAPARGPYQVLDDAGFPSVVATNCEQEYMRYLRPGDRLNMNSIVESISAEKSTALGTGHFVTTLQRFTTEDGELVGTMRFRVFRFRPRAKERAAEAGDGEPGEKPAGRRPRPDAKSRHPALLGRRGRG